VTVVTVRLTNVQFEPQLERSPKRCRKSGTKRGQSDGQVESTYRVPRLPLVTQSKASGQGSIDEGARLSWRGSFISSKAVPSGTDLERAGPDPEAHGKRTTPRHDDGRRCQHSSNDSPQPYKSNLGPPLLLHPFLQ
jgi:hypothetical protein